MEGGACGGGLYHNLRAGLAARPGGEGKGPWRREPGASDGGARWGWGRGLVVCGAPSLGAPESAHGPPRCLRRAPAARNGRGGLGPSTGADFLRPRDIVPVSAVSLGRSDGANVLVAGHQSWACGVGLWAMRNGSPNFRLIFVMSSCRVDVVGVLTVGKEVSEVGGQSLAT